MNTTSGANGDGVEIRIKNASNIDFDRVRVVFPGGNKVEYGAVAKGGVSGFHTTSQAYRYAHIYVTAGDREFSLEPIDYVGEQPLAPGRYTYVLRIDADRLSVDLESGD